MVCVRINHYYSREKMKLKYGLLIMSLVATIFSMVACSPAGGSPASNEAEPTAENEANIAEEKNLYVGPELVDCVGVGPMKCMQVKEDPNGDYLLFYSPIEGFEFEPGHEYELRVRVETVANPPADGSSLRYILVEEMSKIPVSDNLESAAKENTTMLEGTRWELVSLLDADGQTGALLPGSEVFAEFKNSRLTGKGGCNNFFGGYTVDGNNLTVSPLGSTMMACAEDLMRQEAAFLTALQSAATFAIDGDQMQIMNAAGDTVLTMVAAEPVTLTGVTWSAMMVNNGREAVSSLVANTSITAVFSEDGKLNGSAGCNRYMTTYSVDGENITIQSPATTRMMCPGEGIMEQEAAYLKMLPQVSTYKISGDKLELRTADGALVASYVVENAAADES